MPNKDGLLVVVSGPAGSGKSTIVDTLISKHPLTARRAVTATTRSPRPGEEDGVAYYFLKREEFVEMLDNGEFLEHTEFNGNLYGTPKFSLDRELSKGGVVLLVIEVEGAEAVKFIFPHAIFVFIIPPTPAELRRRLECRGTESREDIENRLSIARGEMECMGEYDFLVINDDIETATNDLCAVIRAVDRSLIFGGELEDWEAGLYSKWDTKRLL